MIAVQVENIRRVVARYREFTDRGGRTRVLAKPYFTIARAGELELHNVPVPREPVSARSTWASEATIRRSGRRPAFIRQALNKLGPARQVLGPGGRSAADPLPAIRAPIIRPGC